MKEKNPHVGHRERLRQEFIRLGADSFSEVRALELLLFYALPRVDTNPLAHALLDRFGSLHAVLSASVAELCTVDGVGESTAVLIRLVPELYRRGETELKRKKITSVRNSAAAGELAMSFFKGENSEKFLLFCLDAKNNLTKWEEISRGVVNSVNVDIRRVAELALLNKAVSCVVAHNHPSGDVSPSREDRAVTEQIASALSALHISLLDHIIVGRDEYFSFADASLL